MMRIAIMKCIEFEGRKKKREKDKDDDEDEDEERRGERMQNEEGVK